MKKQHKGVWIGVEDKNQDAAYKEAVEREFKEIPSLDELSEKASSLLSGNRRDFLKFLGFSVGAATVAAGCDTPVRKAIPYVVKPDTIVPGVATYYASSFVQGGDYCAVLVKTREGRPIKIEGNVLSNVTMGGTSARAQASVLSLYDTNRVKGPGKIVDGKVEEMSWEELDKTVKAGLSTDAQIRIVANTVMSPTAKKAISEFAAKYPNTKVVMYDPVSSSAILQANEETLGDRVIPDYHFDKSKVTVSFGADFLGTWISPVEYAAKYIKNRKIKDVKKASMSWHVQVESSMSLTGSNADNRILIKPSEQGAAIATLLNEVASLTGGSSVNAPKLNDRAAAAMKRVAKRLVENKGKSLVISGSNNKSEQILINEINHMLNNYGATITLEEASMQRQGNDKAVRDLVKEMNNGSVGALIVMGANPGFDLPDAADFKSGMEKVGLKVAFNGTIDETSSMCDYIAPNHNFLESWGDVEPKRGHYSLIQPTIAPLFNTRQAEQSLLTWADSEGLDNTAEQPYYEYLKAHWQEAIFPQQNDYQTFQAFWDNTVHDGVFHANAGERPVNYTSKASIAAAQVTKPASNELEVAFYESVNLGTGQYADIPWLMEMPDPINRTVWGNYLMVPTEWDGNKRFVGYNGLSTNMDVSDKADLEVNGMKQQCTIITQFGLMSNTAALALGYGREVSGKCAKGVGQNVFPWLWIDSDGNTQYYASEATLSGPTGQDDEFACVQFHNTMGVKGMAEGSEEPINVDEKAVVDFLGFSGYQGSLTNRSIIYQESLTNLDDLVHKIEEKRAEAKKLNDHTLYPYEEYKETVYGQGHHWGMYVDLTSCIGCGACTVACMSENNVPVVGKREVHRHHEMTWLRIDRYFYGDAENPNVVYQPLMCQHCDNAPCENVCPVNATNHSSEGLNQMAYNRCVGTRYCANNCPYKVRRFNWLDYNTADLFPQNENYPFEDDKPYYADNLVRMVLNPDVTVRSRGVIEKCSFCVQRIQEGKLTAKREQRSLSDSDVKTACQTACPTGAIVFGDTNNEKGEMHKDMNGPLVYRVLEEVNTQSSVYYSARINNKDEELDA